jgi:hypothetical protein
LTLGVVEVCHHVSRKLLRYHVHHAVLMLIVAPANAGAYAGAMLCSTVVLSVLCNSIIWALIAGLITAV